MAAESAPSTLVARLARRFGLKGPSWVMAANETCDQTALDLAHAYLNEHELDALLIIALDVWPDWQRQARRTAAKTEADRAAASLSEGGGALLLTRNEPESAGFTKPPWVGDRNQFCLRADHGIQRLHINLTPLIGRHKVNLKTKAA